MQPRPSGTKTAIIYQTHVRAFFDTQQRRHRRFSGLTRKLDYLQDLGVNILWLLPFYPSPLRDDGYDIADYTAVHPELRHARRLQGLPARRRIAAGCASSPSWSSITPATSTRGSRSRGARSPARRGATSTSGATRPTSTKTRASSSRTSRRRTGRGIRWRRRITGTASSRISPISISTIPPSTRRCSRRLDFWMDLGVDAFRLDAIPYLYEREGTTCENLPETHAYLKELRAHIDAKYPGRMLLAEANQWPEDSLPYFGDGDECHMAFHFPVMPRMYMALAHGGPLPDHRHHGPDAADPGELPVGDVPPQSRRADAGDGHRRRPRLHVAHLRRRPPGAHQPRHPPPPRAAAARTIAAASI